MPKIISIILFCLCIFLKRYVGAKDVWHSDQFGNGARNREDLIVKNVASDHTFNWGEHVTHWKSIAIEEKSYAVGIRNSGITILSFARESNHDNFTITSKEIDTNVTVSDVTLLQEWNKNEKKSDVILILAATDMQLNWYKINDDLTLVKQQFWKWPLQHILVHLNTFKVFEKNAVLLINEEQNNYTTVDIYEFTLRKNAPDFRLLQTIHLECFAENTAITSFAMDTFLTIPQERIGQVLLYKFLNNQFVPFFNLTNVNSKYVNAFNVGFKSFVTVGGTNGGIYAIDKNGLVKQEISEHNLDEIHFWFPVPVNNFREEAIVIAQRNIEHGTHISFALEIIMYDGHTFVVHDEVPCSFHGESEHGLDCILDDEMDQGAVGSAVISMGNTIGVLVPRKESYSGLFIVHTELEPVESSVNAEFRRLMEMRSKIEEMIRCQNEKISYIEKRIKNGLKPNGENKISAPWVVEELHVESMVVENPVTWIEPEKQVQNDFQSLVKKVVNATEEIEQFEKGVGINLVGLKKELVEVDELTIIGDLEIQGVGDFDEVFVESINDAPANVTLDDIVRSDKVDKVILNKTVKNIRCEELTFSSVNNINASNFVYKSDNITINGDVTFLNPVRILQDVLVENGGTINGKVFTEEVVEINRLHNTSITFETLEIQHNVKIHTLNDVLLSEFNNLNHLTTLTLKNVTIPYNITVERVNGVNFTQFLRSICLVNISCSIPGEVKIFGDVNVQSGGLIRYLNNLRFPQDFLLSTYRNSSSTHRNFREISAKKTFLNGIAANEVTAKHGIAEMDSMGHIDLTSHQSDIGNFTFVNLEITEKLDVGNETYGPHIKQFLPNPTLSNATREVKSNVVFKTLEVEGNIYVAGLFNGTTMDNLLEHIVYKDEDNITINAVKQFSQSITIEKDLQILSKTINKSPLNSFVSKNTDQEIVMGTLNANVTFENLCVDGLVDEINVTELYQESIKLSGQQYITSELEFVDSELIVNQLEVKELNGFFAQNILATSNFSITNGSQFEDILCDLVVVEEELNGNVLDFDVIDISRRALSKTREQNITGAFKIETCVINNAEIGFLQQNNPKEVEIIDSESLLELLQSQNNSLKELYVEGSLNINYINDFNLNELLSRIIYTDDALRFPKNVTFLNDVIFENLNVRNFNKINFNDFIGEVVYKNETDVIIESEKYFLNGFEVSGNISTNSISGVPLEELVENSNIFYKPVVIKGNLIIKAPVQVGILNGVPLEKLAESFEVLDSKTYLVHGDVIFERLAFVENLYLDGKANEVNANDFLQSIVYRNSNVILSATTTFANKVEIESNLEITQTVNGIPITSFLNDLVLITEDANIDSLVTFASPVVVHNELFVDTYLDAESVSGIKLNEWNNALYVNKGRILRELHFEDVVVWNNININTLNNVDVSTYIPLNTEQTIPASLLFDKVQVKKDVAIGGSFNGINLKEELDNTLLIDLAQNIQSSIIFTEQVTVRGDAQIQNVLNSFHMNSIVSTNLPQNLTANYIFQEVHLPNNSLLYSGLINNVNTTIWEQNVLKKRADYVQNITNDFTASEISFVGDISSSGLIGGLDLKNVSNEVEEIVRYNKAQSSELHRKYQSTCNDVQYLIAGIKKQTYIFKYFDILQIITETDKTMQNVYSFADNTDNYLLISSVNECKAKMFIWYDDMFHYFDAFEMGIVEQIITVNNPNGNTIFVSRGPIDENGLGENCDVVGTNIWMFKDELLMHLSTIKPATLLQDSAKPDTFYTLGDGIVSEYGPSYNDVHFRVIRQWFVQGDNLAFVPRGAKTGLALRDGSKLLKLYQPDPYIGAQNDFFAAMSHNLEIIENFNYSVDYNKNIPAATEGEMLVLPITNSFGKKNLVAISSHEVTHVRGQFDFIKIFDDILGEEVFHKVQTDNPSSLVTMDFGNGQTLLIFLEDKKLLSVFEYKGIEGFKHRSSFRVDASKLFTISLKMRKSKADMKILGLIQNNRLTLLKAVMAGNPINMKNFSCTID